MRWLFHFVESRDCLKISEPAVMQPFVQLQSVPRFDGFYQRHSSKDLEQQSRVPAAGKVLIDTE